jgi:hypothetical protein
MFKIGNYIRYKGLNAKITYLSDSYLVAYITDNSGGYHVNVPFSEVESYTDIEETLQAFEKQSETAAKPTRYNKSGATLEVWDAIRMLNLDYMQGNILKYSYRYKDKNGPEDLVKAINYCIKLIANETGIDYYELHKLNPEELAKRIKK